MEIEGTKVFCADTHHKTNFTSVQQLNYKKYTPQNNFYKKYTPQNNFYKKYTPQNNFYNKYTPQNNFYKKYTPQNNFYIRTATKLQKIHTTKQLLQ